MKKQHTQGPWQVVSGDWDDKGNARYTLVGVTTIGTSDARLIAASPDLLEALKLADCLLSGANMNRAIVERKVRSAIAKATGSTE